MKLASVAQRSDMITAIGDDGVYYAIDKLDAHVRNVHHIAISVFIFSEGRLLLQRRAFDKYHSGGLWANTCCSHPTPGETVHACASRRLQEELNLGVPLTPFHTIRYRAKVGQLFENETAHCFYGSWPAGDVMPAPNPLEVAETCWMTLDEIVADLKQNASGYSAWFKIYIDDHRERLQSARELQEPG
jgi:isopentenyl-diphosphate delta-isomerase